MTYSSNVCSDNPGSYQPPPSPPPTPPHKRREAERELHCLHNTMQQHLRVMDYEPSGPFIISIMKLKLNTNTMFKWQKFHQDSANIHTTSNCWSLSIAGLKPLRHQFLSSSRPVHSPFKREIRLDKVQWFAELLSCQ